MPRVRSVPQRRCVGCQLSKPKRELWRIVRTPQGEVHWDPTGKLSGRGVYICPQADCFQAAIRAQRLSRALEVDIPQDVLQRLREKLQV